MEVSPIPSSEYATRMNSPSVYFSKSSNLNMDVSDQEKVESLNYKSRDNPEGNLY